MLQAKTDNQKLNLLVVEDDPYFRHHIAAKLEAYGKVEQASSLPSAMEKLKSRLYSIAFVDLSLDDSGQKNGLEVIREAVSRGVTPIALTNYDDEDTIEKVYELGCKHYFHKVEFREDPARYIGAYLNSQAQAEELEDFFKNEFITQDPALIRNIDLLKHQNLGRSTRILITGPTGVGKTELAKLIHRISEGSNPVFEHLNLAEIPETLIESHIFGHKKGAFSGATSDFDGYFKKAHGGTLFLDEITAIPPYVQRKLLRFLDTGTYAPLGANTKLESDHRLITATCDDIPRLIEEKKLRPDFYFRIKGIEINIPPLKERRGDIPLLIQYFQKKNARRIHLSDQAKRALYQYDWFGNVRELKDIINNIINTGKGKIDLKDLPSHVVHNKNPLAPQTEQKLFTKIAANFIQKHGLPAYQKAMEKEALKFALQQTDGKITKAGDYLRISRAALYRINDDLKKEISS